MKHLVDYQLGVDKVNLAFIKTQQIITSSQPIGIKIQENKHNTLVKRGKNKAVNH